MTITEADRLDMLAELRRCHGDRVGDIIVAHLPPTGWGDVARVQDITRLEVSRVQDITRLEAEIARLDRRIDNLAHAMWAMGGITAAGFIGLFSLIAVKL